jgi:O-antigen/teichoic acid export membrane protein
VWLAGALLTSVDASLFSAASRVALQLTFVILAIQVAFSPAISRLWHRMDRVALEKLLRTGTTVGALGVAVAMLPILVAPGLIMSVLFGSEFGSGSTTLVILSIGSAFSIFGGLCSTALIMTGHEGSQSTAAAITLVTRALLGFALFQLIGPIGIALSSLAANASMNFTLAAITRKRLRVTPWPTARPEFAVLRDTQA